MSQKKGSRTTSPPSRNQSDDGRTKIYYSGGLCLGKEPEDWVLSDVNIMMTFWKLYSFKTKSLVEVPRLQRLVTKEPKQC
jgi:hypothetical protein